MTDATALRALREQVEAALAEYDAFFAGKGKTEVCRAICDAAAFASAAHDRAFGGAESHALARTFMLALIDTTHPDLDYLREKPESGQIARDAAARLRALEGGEG